MVLGWSLTSSASRPSSDRQFDFRLDDQDWAKVCWGRVPKGEARSLPRLLSRRAKWAAVMRRAASPEGGSWRADFEVEDMTPWRLQALARVIDSEFFQGTFHRELSRRTRRRLSYVSADYRLEGAGAPTGDAVVSSYSSPSSARERLAAKEWRLGVAPLVLVRPQPPGPAAPAPQAAAVQAQGPGHGPGSSGGSGRECCEPAAQGGGGRRWWQRGQQRDRGDGAEGPAGDAPQAGQAPVSGPSATYRHRTGEVILWREVWGSWLPSVGRPVRLDGVVCTSRLSWLAHTVAHEMLHAMLFSMCEPFAREAPANMSLQASQAVGGLFVWHGPGGSGECSPGLWSPPVSHCTALPPTVALVLDPQGHGYNFLMLNWYVLGHRGWTYSHQGLRPPRPLPYVL
ncbi:hypothetical protein HYH03_012969 [Edaphochlamys debaryana]|uniref:Uncharacterized protein n=1 Tax=Edaphochlamys debaryana TaxID=47281 RepID=A0A835XZH0_9CHLO|nr:hypothetical protein HYH03_012969 [Edaphochlamys debaryana]|eukprot:KAG2488464.1 hypothetical protein HYH03_012969 [Edaphochlamys debaryana]